MSGINRCGEIGISFVPDGIVTGKKRRIMWAVLAEGVPVETYQRKFPKVDNTQALSLMWQAQQQEIREQRRLSKRLENL